MRTPMENGFGSIGTPCACSISNVSRALCPIARMTCCAGSVYSPSGLRTVSAVMCPLCVDSPAIR